MISVSMEYIQKASDDLDFNGIWSVNKLMSQIEVRITWNLTSLIQTIEAVFCSTLLINFHEHFPKNNTNTSTLVPLSNCNAFNTSLILISKNSFLIN